MKVGSLFAGIGGFDIAFEKQGWKTVWHSEIDPYASKVFAKHFPDSVNVGDITKFHPEPEHAVDILCGGFPCQDISTAGKGAGLDGERSGLWFEYARIIRAIRPRYMVIENVSALLVRGLDRVLGTLAEAGYDAEWKIVSASDVGAPHRRQRLWIVAYATGFGHRQRRIFGNLCETYGRQGRELRSESSGPSEQPEVVADPDSEGLQRRKCEVVRQCSSERATGQGDTPTDPTDIGRGDSEWRATERRLGRTLNGLPGGVHGHWGPGWEDGIPRVVHGQKNRANRLRCLGNAIVPQCAEAWVIPTIKFLEDR